MTDDSLPDRAARAFEAHEAFEAVDGGFSLTTTPFETRVTVAETDSWDLEYTVTVRAPTLAGATADEVGSAVEEGWFETYRRRLADAAMATRAEVALESYDVERRGETAIARFVFEFGNADRAPEVAKAIAEYVEGTYVEGVVPGYEYEPPVADLLAGATRGDDAPAGGTPL